MESYLAAMRRVVGYKPVRKTGAELGLRIDV